MRLVKVLAILSLTACGNEGNIKYYQTDEIKAIAERFESEIKHIGNIVIIIVDKIDPSEEAKKKAILPYTVGQCQLRDSEPPTIVLLKEYWDEATASMKENLIYHELGHCSLLLEHDDSVDEDGRPLSIMYPSQILPLWYDLYRQEYIQDLIDKEKGKHVLYTNNPIQK
jgi:hypothetical protein